MEVVKINCYWGTRMIDNGEDYEMKIAKLKNSG